MRYLSFFKNILRIKIKYLIYLIFEDNCLTLHEYKYNVIINQGYKYLSKLRRLLLHLKN